MTTDLYYLVLEGSNARVVWKDREPLQVEVGHVPEWLEFYETKLRDRPGRLVAIKVKDYWRKFSKSAFTPRVEQGGGESSG